jgi:hypothetical protein
MTPGGSFPGRNPFQVTRVRGTKQTRNSARSPAVKSARHGAVRATRASAGVPFTGPVVPVKGAVEAAGAAIIAGAGLTAAARHPRPAPTHRA